MYTYMPAEGKICIQTAVGSEIRLPVIACNSYNSKAEKFVRVMHCLASPTDPVSNVQQMCRSFVDALDTLGNVKCD